MALYAKSRRRLKYIDYVGIVEDDRGGYHQVLLHQRGKQLWPIGMSYFPSLGAAKKECASTFGIRDADWSELPDGLLAEPEVGAVEALYQEFEEFRKRPWESDPVVPRPTGVTSGMTRTYKQLLLGTWRWGRYELRFDKDVWSLSFKGEMLIRPLSILKKFTGPYNCSTGAIGFMAGLVGSALFIARLDDLELVLTDGKTFTGNFRRV